MIFLKLKIDNFYMFKDTELDFTYPKKIKNSTLDGEFLKNFPNIKYKKVCIFMGANASGKTSLGKIMCSINNYLQGRDFRRVPETICDKEKNASIEVIYVSLDSHNIHKLKIEFNCDELVFESFSTCKLKKSYTLEKMLLELESSPPEFIYDQENKHGIENPGFKSAVYSLGYPLEGGDVWNYSYSDFNTPTRLNERAPNINLLDAILKTFDPSIAYVKKIQESTKDAYIVRFVNNDEIIIEEGKINNHERLSRGTIESIDIAHFIHFIIAEGDGIFFLDEKMAYSHSEMEIAMLNLMIEKLSPNAQLFYTTHNCDILEMNLPSHSYTFMRKGPFVKISHPEKLGYTKNDRSLLGYVKNDVFNTLPDTSKIEALL
ncbi:MAG: hypothetical protein COB22_03615 [Cycloclasticus sp.]|nr:MAG: hypothetical protein COB22_03615 [Cycloclasticus sp.]